MMAFYKSPTSRPEGLVSSSLGHFGMTKFFFCLNLSGAASRRWGLHTERNSLTTLHDFSTGFSTRSGTRHSYKLLALRIPSCQARSQGRLRMRKQPPEKWLFLFVTYVKLLGKFAYFFNAGSSSLNLSKNRIYKCWKSINGCIILENCKKIKQLAMGSFSPLSYLIFPTTLKGHMTRNSKRFVANILL